MCKHIIHSEFQFGAQVTINGVNVLKTVQSVDGDLMDNSDLESRDHLDHLEAPMVANVPLETGSNSLNLINDVEFGRITSLNSNQDNERDHELSNIPMDPTWAYDESEVSLERNPAYNSSEFALQRNPAYVYDTSDPPLDRNPAYETSDPPLDRNPAYETSDPPLDRNPAYETSDPPLDRNPAYETSDPPLDRNPAYETSDPPLDRNPAYETSDPLLDRNPAYGITDPQSDNNLVPEPVDLTNVQMANTTETACAGSTTNDYHASELGEDDNTIESFYATLD